MNHNSCFPVIFTALKPEPYMLDMLKGRICNKQTCLLVFLLLLTPFFFFFCHCSPATSFIQGISGMLPMMLVLAFMYTVCMSIKSLVLEKELRLKEVLRAVGIQNWALWASRFTENIVLLLVPCALISVMVKVSGDASSERNPNTKHPDVHFEAGFS